ncbi:hypothetical protein AB0B15_03015 [Streptomyces sp. NPDC045456]|uniref:hypothetical protein n=1 Tax=Streptomyces sp. NPDC045456 TaxID=3155254 RepID=UPI0033DBF7E7
MSERDNVNDKSRVCDTIISALQEAGHAASHYYADVGYSVVVVELGDGSVLHITDRDWSAHHTEDEHIHPLVIAHLPYPTLPEDYTFVYEGAGGTPLAEDIVACAEAASAFIAEHYPSMVGD